MDRLVPNNSSVESIHMENTPQNKRMNQENKIGKESKLHRFRPPPLTIRDQADQRVPSLPNAYNYATNGEF